jgi:hypothetical protein
VKAELFGRMLDVDKLTQEHWSRPEIEAVLIQLCDDYGFATCLGARQTFDTFTADKPESIVHVPTGRGFVVKK